MTRPSTSLTTLLVAAMLATAAPAARAHGGEEHSHDAEPATGGTTAAVATMQGELLTTSGATGYFEIVAKYPSTPAGDDTRLRLFVADYATNRPIEEATLALAFRPAGAVIRQQPDMVSPGIYDLVVRFPEDTVYHLVATVTAGQRTDFVDVRNIYSGESAERFLEEHAPAATATTAPADDDGNGWIIPALIAAALVATIVVAITTVRRRRRRVDGSGAIARDPELATKGDLAADAEREARDAEQTTTPAEERRP